MDAFNAEIELLLKESYLRNPGYFVILFSQIHFNVIVLEALYVHGAEGCAKTK